jgi:hypothetical protein
MHCSCKIFLASAQASHVILMTADRPAEVAAAKEPHGSTHGEETE